MAPIRNPSYRDLICRLNTAGLVRARDERLTPAAGQEDGRYFIPPGYRPPDVSPELAAELWGLVCDLRERGYSLSYVWGDPVGDGLQKVGGILTNLMETQSTFSSIRRAYIRVEVVKHARANLENLLPPASQPSQSVSLHTKTSETTEPGDNRRRSDSTRDLRPGYIIVAFCLLAGLLIRVWTQRLIQDGW